MTSALVDTQWLSDHLDDPNVVIIDASWHLPTAGRDGSKEYLERHIPGAVFFDIDAISDKTNPLPHMLPSAEQFAQQIAALGIGTESHIVVYDSHGLFSAARVWWMFRAMGHDNVAILNGGLPKWLAEGKNIEQGAPQRASAQSSGRSLNISHVRDRQQVVAALEDKSAQVLDARPKGRFDGTAPEPRPELSSGHMPDSMNLHYAQLINEDGTLKAGDDLARLYTQAGIDLARPIITSCGSGVTAAILTLGLYELGHEQNSLYDGSWTEWASHPEARITFR